MKEEGESMSAHPTIEEVFKDLRVLVVDNDEPSLKLLQINLEKLGSSVTIAHDGPEAVAFAKENEYGACLMDILMPGMNGLDTIRHIRVEGKTKDMPIIVVTAVTTGNIREQCRSVGADAYIMKPMQFEDVKEKIYYWICNK